MADRELRYAFRVECGDGVDRIFTSVDDAKALCRFDSNWDFTKGDLSWSLEDSDMRLVLTWVFTDAEADDQLLVHTKIKNGDWSHTLPADGAENNPTGSHPRHEVSQEHYRAHGRSQD